MTAMEVFISVLA